VAVTDLFVTGARSRQSMPLKIGLSEQCHKPTASAKADFTGCGPPAQLRLRRGATTAVPRIHLQINDIWTKTRCQWCRRCACCNFSVMELHQALCTGCRTSSLQRVAGHPPGGFRLCGV